MSTVGARRPQGPAIAPQPLASIHIHWGRSCRPARLRCSPSKSCGSAFRLAWPQKLVELLTDRCDPRGQRVCTVDNGTSLRAHGVVYGAPGVAHCTSHALRLPAAQAMIQPALPFIAFLARRMPFICAVLHLFASCLVVQFPQPAQLTAACAAGSGHAHCRCPAMWAAKSACQTAATARTKAAWRMPQSTLWPAVVYHIDRWAWLCPVPSGLAFVSLHHCPLLQPCHTHRQPPASGRKVDGAFPTAVCVPIDLSRQHQERTAPQLMVAATLHCDSLTCVTGPPSQMQSNPPTRIGYLPGSRLPSTSTMSNMSCGCLVQDAGRGPRNNTLV